MHLCPRGVTSACPSVIGQEKRGKDKRAKNVPAMSSKAKGIDRLTGRARRSVTMKYQHLSGLMFVPVVSAKTQWKIKYGKQMWGLVLFPCALP